MRGFNLGFASSYSLFYHAGEIGVNFDLIPFDTLEQSERVRRPAASSGVFCNGFHKRIFYVRLPLDIPIILHRFMGCGRGIALPVNFCTRGGAVGMRRMRCGITPKK
jgi:hypothetical protein